MRWQEVCEHPDLQNLPFKIELDEHGKILMSPVKVYHSVFQGEIAALLKSFRKDGKVLTECAVKTHKGTKVADVAWVSKTIFNTIKHEAECSVAPELCIEILSSSNTNDEIEEKKACIFPVEPERSGYATHRATSHFLLLEIKLRNQPSFLNFRRIWSMTHNSYLSGV